MSQKFLLLHMGMMKTSYRPIKHGTEAPTPIIDAVIDLKQADKELGSRVTTRK